LALVSLALILALGTSPLHALILRRRPEDIGVAPDGAAAPSAAGSLAALSSPDIIHEQSVPTRAALRGSAFWGLAAAFALTTLMAGALTVHLVPYLIDQGYAPSFAASMVGLIGIMSLPGRLVFTLLGEHVSRRLVTALLFALQAVSLPILLLTPGAAGVFGFVVLFGASFGAITPARAALIADYYGSKHYARINSMLGLFITGARAIAPVGAGLFYELLGTYSLIFWALAGLSALAAGALLLVG
ncbi:MAG TPA: MFS transporter, partial [Ktedonobacterales bacterium]|nr:MFS transporter [Ktedonobacterales bacterium]